ncbi:hypothetical protein WJX75_002999 [Coccomyxa subellipsoidea]|uniref:Uncharacterized protein n=1 Tax=Coccomyxa subellipsoidea TaxID=248742 RepID=A0ABR2YG98_9CHLO
MRLARPGSAVWLGVEAVQRKFLAAVDHKATVYVKRAFHLAVSAHKRPFTRSVRPVPVRIVSISKNNSSGADLLAGELLKKLERYTEASELIIRPNPKKSVDPRVAMQAEGDKVLKLLRPQDRVIVLDERGKDATSEKFADMIAENRPEMKGWVQWSSV